MLGNGEEVSYLDGGEELVGAIVAEAADRGSMSDELHIAAKAWVEQYHLDRGRANVLRALDLPADTAVLDAALGPDTPVLRKPFGIDALVKMLDAQLRDRA